MTQHKSVARFNAAHQAVIPSIVPVQSRQTATQINFSTDIVDSIPCLLAYLDAGGYYQFANRCYERWLGLRPEYLIGKHVREIIDDTSYARLKPLIHRMLTCGEAVEFEGKIVYRSGKERWLSAQYIPAIGLDGNIQGTYALAMDISTQKNAEAALRISEQQFRDLVEGSLQGILIHRH